MHVLDLNSLKIKAGLGAWTLVSTPAGINPGTLVGSIFDATNKDFGTYVVQYTLNPVPTEPALSNQYQTEYCRKPRG
jgi:hypothetical protein